MTFHGLLERLRNDVRLLEAWGRRPKPKPKPKPKPAPKPKPKPPVPVKPPPKPPTKPHKITMYDSITVVTVPLHAEAVAGYVDGKWPTYKGLVKSFPLAHHLSIAVFASDDADCLDIENGDATPDQAPAWVKRQHLRGVTRPVVYASLSAMGGLLVHLQAAGVPRATVRVWTAHYTYQAHICDRNCGYGLGTTADATQWTDKAFGRNLDESLCSPTFFQH